LCIWLNCIPLLHRICVMEMIYNWIICVCHHNAKDVSHTTFAFFIPLRLLSGQFYKTLFNPVVRHKLWCHVSTYIKLCHDACTALFQHLTLQIKFSCVLCKWRMDLFVRLFNALVYFRMRSLCTQGSTILL
jgi:hypothetical protein